MYNVLFFKVLLPLIITYGLSVVISSGMFMSLLFSFLKILADNGYTISFTDSSKTVKNSIQNNKEFKIRLVFVFGLNIYLPLILLKDYEQFFMDMYDEVKKELVPLENYEIKEYQKRPTGFKAFMIMEKRVINKHMIKNLNISTLEGTSDVTILIKRRKIKILDVTGPIKKLSKKEQEKIILEEYSKIIDNLLMENLTSEEILEKLYTVDKYDCEIKEENSTFSYKVKDGEIIWKYSDDFNDIIIVKTLGSARQMDEATIKNLIIFSLKEAYSKYLKNWEDLINYQVPEVKEETRSRRKKS